MRTQIESDIPYLIAQINLIKHEKEYLKVSEWAERNRYLPPELSPQYGHWDNSVTPYLVEIMDCFSESSYVRHVSFMKGAQIGATTGIIENFIGYIIDHVPAPTMFMQADKEMAELAVELRIDRMITTANLQDKIFSQGKSNDNFNRKTGSTKSKKEFIGGFLLARGSNSPAKLRMVSIKYLLMDEVDGFAYSAGKEGDPVVLAEKRTAAYSSTRKIFAASTPANLKTSKINKLYLRGDQRKYHVPCKDCGHFQELIFEKNKDGFGGIVYEKDENGNLIIDSVGYSCVECGVIWKNSDKINFLPKGKWIPTATSTEYTRRSYHLNSLYSPIGMYSWVDACQEWIACDRDTNKLKAFINTVLGLPWEERGDPKKGRQIRNNRISYLAGTIPDDVLFLTAACDVHKNRIDVEILGWGIDQVSYSIKWLSIEGDTSTSKGSAWTDLEKLIMSPIGKHRISMTLVDSGYLTDLVYRFCARFGAGVFPLKGVQKYNGKNAYKLVDVKGYGSLQCLNVVVDFYKDRLAAWIEKKVEKTNDGGEHFPWGLCFYPADYDDAYFKQYTNEQKMEVVDAKGEVSGYEWRKISSSAPNHAWDCRVYNVVAFDFYLDLMRENQGDNFTIEQFYKLIQS